MPSGKALLLLAGAAGVALLAMRGQATSSSGAPAGSSPPPGSGTGPSTVLPPHAIPLSGFPGIFFLLNPDGRTYTTYGDPSPFFGNPPSSAMIEAFWDARDSAVAGLMGISLAQFRGTV